MLDRLDPQARRISRIDPLPDDTTLDEIYAIQDQAMQRQSFRTEVTGSMVLRYRSEQSARRRLAAAVQEHRTETARRIQKEVLVPDAPEEEEVLVTDSSQTEEGSELCAV